MDSKGKPTPIHQWTHDGGKVLLVKCADKDGKTYAGNDVDGEPFQWPTSGPVEPKHWSFESTCESGGLFGWPWGIGIGGGKEPDYTGRWIVFAADPADVVAIGEDKAKARCGEVLYFGDWWGALLMVDAGRVAWTIHAASGASSATGWRGASSATGWSGASSATGERGASSATGESGASSATGERGASSATGERGAAVTTGEFSTLECGATGLCATTAETVYWITHPGAVLLQRCGDIVALFKADELSVPDGTVVKIIRGAIQERDGQ